MRRSRRPILFWLLRLQKALLQLRGYTANLMNFRRLPSWCTCVEGTVLSVMSKSQQTKEAYGLTKKEYSRCFKLLDEHARTKHNCFVSKFFLSEDRLFRTAQAWVLAARLI